MSVLFRYSTKNKDGIFVEKVCFGRSLTPVKLEYNGYIWDFDYLDFSLKNQGINSKFSIPLVDQVIEKFQWMKEVFTLVETDGDKFYRFDLSKPADTVWFCLNVVRLILKGTQHNFDIKDYNTLLGNIEGDLWSKIVFLNSVSIYKEYVGQTFAKSWTGKMKMSGFSVPENTCLVSPLFMEENVLKAVLEDPIQVLNKLPSVKESKTGFLLKSNTLEYYWIPQKHRTTINNKFSDSFCYSLKPIEGVTGSNGILNDISAYWTSIEVMNGTHEIDQIPHQSDSICREYKGFNDLKEWYLFCGLPEESFDKLFVNTTVVGNNRYEHMDQVEE